MQSAPAIDLSAIPAAQRAAVQTLMETVAALTDITRRQKHLIAELNHALHGMRSEKLTEDERQLAFEETDGPFTQIDDRPAEPADAPKAVIAIAHARKLDPSVIDRAIRSNLKTLLR